MANGIITEKKGKSKKAEVTKLQIKIMKKKAGRTDMETSNSRGKGNEKEGDGKEMWKRGRWI